MNSKNEQQKDKIEKLRGSADRREEIHTGRTLCRSSRTLQRPNGRRKLLRAIPGQKEYGKIPPLGNWSRNILDLPQVGEERQYRIAQGSTHSL